MSKLNYINFVNPPQTYSGLPHARCMIWKPKKEHSNTSGIDYINRPRINWQHLAKVLEAKFIKQSNK